MRLQISENWSLTISSFDKFLDCPESLSLTIHSNKILKSSPLETEGSWIQSS